MSELEKIKDRVRKLLALSKSDNENEAMLALEKANALMADYNLDESALRYESVEVKTVKSYSRWRTTLANAMDYLYCCYHYHSTNSGRGTFVFFGEPSDVFLATEMYEYLVKTIERSAKKHIRKNAKSVFRDSYKLGMARRIRNMIEEMGESVSWAPLRASKQKEVQAWVEKNVALENKDQKKGTISNAALERGFRHGGDVSLARQAGYSGENAPRIAAAGTSMTQGELSGIYQWQGQSPE
jgi:hypothetical protein